MSAQPVMRVERHAFSTMQEASAGVASQGLRPTTHIVNPLPELRLHWHWRAMQGYLEKVDAYAASDRVNGPGRLETVWSEGALL